MCDARAALFLVVLAAPAARGQSLTELRRRADSLAQVWRETEALANLADSIRWMKASAGRDTVRAGALVVLANPSALPMRQAVARAWTTLEAFYGDAAGSLIDRPLVLHVLSDTASEPDHARRQEAERADLQIPGDLGLADLTRVVVTSAPVHPADEALREWVGGRVGPDVLAERTRAGVHVELVTARSPAVRACFLGDLAGCRDALNLAPGPDPFLRWYDARERRRLVADGLVFSRGPNRDTFDRCARRAIDAACVELLRSIPAAAMPQPLSVSARQSLVSTALRLGGPAGYRRLIDTADRLVGDRLAATSAGSLDSVLAAWRAQILASRPVPVTLPAWGPAIALVWTVVFAACGLGSSRWRAA